jgi:hypothetical protein
MYFRILFIHYFMTLIWYHKIETPLCRIRDRQKFTESIMSNNGNKMNEPWIRGLTVNPNVAIFADFIGFSRRPDLAALKYKIVAPIKQRFTDEELRQIPSLPLRNSVNFRRLPSPEISQIKEDEEYDRRQDIDNFWREIEEIEKREEKKMYAKNRDRSLEELRQQLTCNVDETGEVHLVKRDINNNNLHITRISKERNIVETPSTTSTEFTRFPTTIVSGNLQTNDSL